MNRKTSSIPEWAIDFSDLVFPCLNVMGESFPIGTEWDYSRPCQNSYGVHLFRFWPALGRVCGGPDDGAEVFGRTSVEIMDLIDVFDRCDYAAYSSTAYGDHPRELHFEGLFRRRKIAVQIFDEPVPGHDKVRVLVNEDGSYVEM